MSNFKKFLALVLATLMVASVMVFTAPAAAAATDDHADDIAFLGAIDVFKGYSADNLGADDNILRYQMALFIARIDTGITDDSFWQNGASAYFTDCNEHTYPGAIDYCYKKGYINGKGDGIFDPWGQINYQEALTMLVRLLGREKKTDVFPIDQYITASKLGLTANIDGTLTKALKRNEIADLVVKTINKEVLDAEGKSEGKLIETVLGAKNIGTATLVATWNASVDGVAFANYGEYKFTYAGATEPVVVTSEKLTKGDLDVNNYLGFTADLVSMTVKDKVVYLATMHDVVVAEANVAKNNEITVNGKKFANTAVEVFGTKTNEVFVANTADIAKGTKGKAIVCDTDKNGVDAGDIVRFIPYNTVKAVYAQDVKVTKTDAQKWPFTGNVTLYYVPKWTSKEVRVVADVMVAGATANKKGHEEAKCYGLAHTGLNGTRYANGISDSGSATDKPVRTALTDYKYSICTDLFVSVVGDFVNAEPMLCNITTIGGNNTVGAVTFVTVGKQVAIETGRGVVNAISTTDLTIGETSIPAGYADANTAITKTKWESLNAYDFNWFYTFAEAETLVTDKTTPLIGKEVNYTKVDGKIVALELYNEPAATTPTPEKTYLTDKMTATPLFVKIAKNAELKVAEDGTIAIDVLDPMTLTTSTVKFDQINGKKIGALVNQFGYEAVKDILEIKSTSNKLVDGVKELLAVEGNEFKHNTGKTSEYTMYLVTVANKADDVYAISTTNNANIKKVVLGSAAASTSKADDNGTQDLSFVAYPSASLSNKAYYVGTFDAKVENKTGATPKYTYATKYLTVNKDTEIIVIGSDTTKSFKDLTPGAKDHLLLADSGNAFVLALSDNLVVVVNNDKKVSEIASFGNSTPIVNVEVEGGWYTLTWTSQYVSTTAETVDGVTYYLYTFKDLYNLSTGEKEQVVVSSKDYYTFNTEDFIKTPVGHFFGDSWINKADPMGLNVDVKNDAYVTQTKTQRIDTDGDGKLNDDAAGTLNDLIGQDTYDVFYISNAKGSEVSESSIYSWGKANGYRFALVSDNGILKNDKNTFVVTEYELGCKVDGTYTFNKVEGTDPITSVLDMSMTILNQSYNSKTDEWVVKTGAESGAYGPKLAGANNINGNEVILFKLVDGVVEIFANCGDDFGEAIITNGVADALAKAAN